MLYKDRKLPRYCFRLSFNIDILLFFFRYFRRKIVLLRHRAVVAYGCLFSGLHDICNTFTQVAERYNVLILKKKDKMRHLIFSVSKFQKSIMKRRFRFICKKYRFEIGHKICKARIFPRIRYVIDKNQFGYADFGDPAIPAARC